MFRVLSLFNRIPRWTMSQSLSSRDSHHSLTSSLNPRSIRHPKLRQLWNPIHNVVAADDGDMRIPERIGTSQAFSGISAHNHRSFATEMEITESSKSSASFAKQLWEMSEREAYYALYHPFVVAMAAGSLPLESFRDFIAQDVFFLEAFSKAYGLAIDNTDDEQAKDVLRGLQSSVQNELDQVHVSAMQSFGLDLTSHANPNSATTAYTEFLLSVAKGDFHSPRVPQMGNNGSGEDDEEELEDEREKSSRRGRKLAAFTIGACTPCMRLYAFLGQEIRRTFSSGQRANPYVKWVETYAADDFEAASLESEKLLDKLALCFSGEQEDREWRTMRNLYLRAMELEVDFFSAQTVSNNNKCTELVPLLKSARAATTHFVLVSDFDLTCTLEDSCSVLAQLVMSVADSAKVSHLETTWKDLGTQYSLEYKKLLDRLLPQPQQQQQEQRAEEYDPQALRQVLKEMSAFEHEANARVVKSEFLAGLSMEAVKEAGRRVPFHQGCENLLKMVSEMEQNLEFHVVSVCWSRSLIHGSFSSKRLEFATIHSNELQFNNLLLSDGVIDRRIESAVDKEVVFEKILSQAEENSRQKQDSLSIYIGDGVTDLLCLLRADIGIVVGESSSLNRMAVAFGIKILPLYAGLLQREQQQQQQQIHPNSEDVERTLWTKVDGVLYRVTGWNELNAFLLGC